MKRCIHYFPVWVLCLAVMGCSLPASGESASDGDLATLAPGQTKAVNAAAYRFFVPDSISFKKSLKVAIGFGDKEGSWKKRFSKPDTAVQLSSTVYWYQKQAATPLPPMPPAAERAPTLPAAFHPEKN